MTTNLQEPLTLRGVTLRNRLFLAPVDGIFDTAFRSLAVDLGVGLTCSEMVAVQSFHNARKRTSPKYQRAVNEKPYQFQLAGHEPSLLARSARAIQEEGLADIVDLNMGCPSRLVTGSGNGSALLKTPSLIREIVAAVRAAISIPLTVKFRCGWDESSRNAEEVARICEGEGADLLTLHPRTKTQQFTGHSDWSEIAMVKRVVSIPLIGNGDIKSARDAQQMLSTTGCDGVMVARAAFGDPWVLTRIIENDDGLVPGPAEKAEFIIEHIRRQCELLGDKKGVITMRKHLAWYIRTLPGAAQFRREAFILDDRDEVERRIRAFFGGLHLMAD